MRYLVLAVSLLVATPAFAQNGIDNAAPRFTPAQQRENAAVRRAFERAQAASPECQRMHIGCPEGTFTQHAGDR